jgi:hypothetical protein
MEDETVNGSAGGEPDGPNRTPPYISFATLLTFLKALKTDGVPPQIDKSVLSKMSGAAQGQLKMALRSLGLMVEGGKPTALLNAMAAAFDTPEFESLLLERLNATYPYVFALDLMNATPTMFADAFKVTGAKEGVLRKCRTFFLHAAKRAGVSLGPRLLNGSVPRSPRAGVTKKKPKGNPDPNAAGTPGDGSKPQHNDKGILGQLLTKFPDFDPAWPDDIKVKWFEGFEQFMKGAKSGG